MIAERCTLKEKSVKSYRKHIIEAISKRRNLSREFDIDVLCPECENQLQRGGFGTNDGGGIWSAGAYCGKCGWTGVYFYIREKL